MRNAVIAMCLVMGLCVGCSFHAQAETSPSEEVFEVVWRTFDRHYALFKAKSIDWNVLYEVYRPQVGPETTEKELFGILTAMLGHLNDSHVILQANSLGEEFSAGLLGQYVNELGVSGAIALLQRRPLPAHYFRSEPREAWDGRFQYGWVDEGIGYVYFREFDDAAQSGAAIDAILKEFAGVRALIVDVRRNSGGDDVVGKTIANRFADRDRLYMVTRDRNGPNHGDFADPTYWQLSPADQVFTGPVVLLTSRLSVSAAENFALAMRVLPHVTVVGDFTSGCFADMKWFDLPNGWRLSLSRNWFVDYAGRCWEGIGVPPDIMVRTGDPDGDVDPVMDFTLRLLQGEGPALQNESASAAAVQVSLVKRLEQDLESMDFDRARRAFDRSRKSLPPQSWYVRGIELNALGYRLMSAGRLEEAVAVFQLYVELFPTEANAYDSLGEAYMNHGDTEQAIASYQRSLELNPDNENAVKMLMKLRK